MNIDKILKVKIPRNSFHNQHILCQCLSKMCFYPYPFSLVLVMSPLVMSDLNHFTWRSLHGNPSCPKQFQVSAPETLLPGALSWSLILCSHHLFLRGRWGTDSGRTEEVSLHTSFCFFPLYFKYFLNCTLNITCLLLAAANKNFATALIPPCVL